MAEYGIPLAVVGLGVYLVAILQFRFSHQERPYIWACFAAHVFSSFALVLLTRYYFGGGDMFAYQAMGLWLRDLLHADFGHHFPDVVRLFFQQETQFSVHSMGHGATGSMSAVTGMLLFVLGGSFYATNLAISLAAFLGQLAIYIALRSCFPATTRRRLLIAILLVPSVVFWSSGALKEAVSLAGLGWMILAAVRLAYGQLRGKHVLLLVPSVVLVAQIKPYILVPFSISAGTIYYWRRAQVSGRREIPAIKPIYLVFAVALGLGGILLVGELFPRFAIENLAEEAARLQDVGQNVEGGSNYDIGDPSKRSLVGQLTFAPWGIISALLRPFIFEAGNIVGFVNALETTAFLILGIGVLRLARRGNVLRLIMESPALMMCITFTLAFAVGVGLATTNMGTLSRYRIPMVPFYLTTLLLLQVPRQRAR